MDSFSITMVLQVLVALGLLNVWLVRARSATSYRGGESRSLKGEFSAYGLPEATFYIVGGLKISAAILLLAGVWYPQVVRPAASVVALLMVGALAMHMKVKDPLMRSVPALLMLLMSGAIILL
ncbi:MAG: DoxX family protein [Gemmatimonadetes bacterium]|nr:DoxX family protein [Gemmatimonadota bacterium]NNM07506.1 DoxX family protein [Gemmatimonadota bacterium]